MGDTKEPVKDKHEYNCYYDSGNSTFNFLRILTNRSVKIPVSSDSNQYGRDQEDQEDDLLNS